jgi:hypothetical protein
VESGGEKMLRGPEDEDQQDEGTTDRGEDSNEGSTDQEQSGEE